MRHTAAGAHMRTRGLSCATPAPLALPPTACPRPPITCPIPTRIHWLQTERAKHSKPPISELSGGDALPAGRWRGKGVDCRANFSKELFAHHHRCEVSFVSKRFYPFNPTTRLLLRRGHQ